jgi:hypothetical protein
MLLLPLLLTDRSNPQQYFSIHQFCIRWMNLPGTNDFTLGPSAHTDIGALGGLVTNKETDSRKGKDNHSQDGVGGRVTEPSLGKRG